MNLNQFDNSLRRAMEGADNGLYVETIRVVKIKLPGMVDSLFLAIEHSGNFFGFEINTSGMGEEL